MTGNIKMMDLLLQKGVDVNCANSNGDTPLHCAIMNGFHQCINLLLAYGANENTKN